MNILIRTRLHPSEPASERRLEAATLRIGRGSEQDLVLADLRLAIAHAEITPGVGKLPGRLRVAAPRLALRLNGQLVADAPLAVGDAIDLGRHRITVLARVPDSDLVIEVVERHAASEESDARRQKLKLTLAEAGLSRRPWAWALFLVVLLPGLALPLWQALSRPDTDPASRRQQTTAPMGWDISWSSGPLASAHQSLRNDCGACHRKAFVPVEDTSCTGCHNALPDHPASTQVAARPPFTAQGCTDCHREHNGPHGVTPTNDRECTVCHADPGKLPGEPGLAVHDFSRDHPAFRLRLPQPAVAGSAEAFVWPAVRQGDTPGPRQDSGLKFPHDKHLLSRGVDAPEGLRVLDCADCHSPTADRTGFAPVRMETHCADCHRLDFDPREPDRLLPHGSPETAAQTLRDHYARVALAGGVTDARAPDAVRERRRPGETLSANRARIALNWADQRAEETLTEVFKRRTCHSCHTISRETDGRWHVAPVAPMRSAFAAHVFPHDAHATEDCGRCHEAGKSKKAQEVLLPDITTCRDCHGDTATGVKTPTNCQSCHDYHQHPRATAVRP